MATFSTGSLHQTFDRGWNPRHCRAKSEAWRAYVDSILLNQRIHFIFMENMQFIYSNVFLIFFYFLSTY